VLGTLGSAAASDEGAGSDAGAASDAAGGGVVCAGCDFVQLTSKVKINTAFLNIKAPLFVTATRANG